MNRALEELLEQIEDTRSAAPHASDVLDSVAKIIKEELKKSRQTSPAIGQKYWACPPMRALHLYSADEYDLDVLRFCDIYPEERFAEAELRAKELISAVNKRRRELNEGKEFGDRQYFILSVSGLEAWGHSDRTYAQWQSYPFGLFKDSSDCDTCIGEFKDELEWFYREYLPLMAELDDYDWAEQPGWGECNAKKGCKA